MRINVVKGVLLDSIMSKIKNLGKGITLDLICYQGYVSESLLEEEGLNYGGGSDLKSRYYMAETLFCSPYRSSSSSHTF